LIDELMQKGKSEVEAIRIVAEMQKVAKGQTLPPSVAPPLAPER
jgi:uncharacterized protein YoaH (UPF0181 family)